MGSDKVGRDVNDDVDTVGKDVKGNVAGRKLGDGEIMSLSPVIVSFVATAST